MLQMNASYSGLLVSFIHSYLAYSLFHFSFSHFTKTTLLELGITSPVFAIYTYLPRMNKDHLFVIFHTCSMYLLRPVHRRLHNYQHLMIKHTLH